MVNASMSITSAYLLAMRPDPLSLSNQLLTVKSDMNIS